jgi:hypothetical protein
VGSGPTFLWMFLWMWGSQRFKVGTGRGGEAGRGNYLRAVRICRMSCVVVSRCLSSPFFAHINLFLIRNALASRGADFREDKTRRRRREERKFRFALKSGWVRYEVLCVPPEEDRVFFRSSRGQKTQK